MRDHASRTCNVWMISGLLFSSEASASCVIYESFDWCEAQSCLDEHRAFSQCLAPPRPLSCYDHVLKHSRSQVLLHRRVWTRAVAGCAYT
ncbi:hypothetical protein CLAFUW4_20016 [Fulvia fulva]|uniref:uncharacterized protein n=1 Tax=Passalora fulva TaxID=5499 RepID=UPI002852B17A|nr:uncharacterized protein CLAFUR5_20016 [Fulvia fulva]KAK4631627.1 hypothetical protein CLAFUR4_20016 [Fulvia fulva]KAK4633782.1 hypothetical protein CLAFUR0_20016 [Fulvia fulva]WMI38786.1 hypothetical protein CLAFUR5_20016 [Fulvia fulva]WPV11480.1 hypothetical protein CLAFUW4_20016 [Fulvia fulva]WPV25959.1 hypothetical protein CLAFUW7_20016 [Fulvia fulva]